MPQNWTYPPCVAFGIPEVAIRADVEAMRALREDAERIKVEMNDECDCSGEVRKLPRFCPFERLYFMLMRTYSRTLAR